MNHPLDLALRLFLPSYFVAYILIAGVVAVASMRRKYGVDPLRVVKPDPIMSVGETCRNILFATALVLVLLNAVRPAWLAYLGPISYLHRPVVQGLGVAVLVGSLLLVRTAQVQMKGSWRFGCDWGEAPPELVTMGLYARSRNPIYLGLVLTSVGLFLTLPNAVTVAMTSLTVLALQVRIRAEEQYLLESHGDAFAAYCRKTPRWIFRLRRER